MNKRKEKGLSREVLEVLNLSQTGLGEKGP